MWKNFIRVTIRSIKKNKAFNAINIAGLAIGLASSIFIILYIISETGYDRFNERSANIYRVYLDGKMAGSEIITASTSPIMGPSMAEDIPEIEKFCRFDFARNRLMSSGSFSCALFRRFIRYVTVESSKRNNSPNLLSLLII